MYLVLPVGWDGILYAAICIRKLLKDGQDDILKLYITEVSYE